MILRTRSTYRVYRFALVVFFLFLPTLAQSAVPGTVTIQGVLETAGGGAVSGTHAYRVRFHGASLGGPMLGELNGSVSLSSAGRFSIELFPAQAALDASESWYDLAVDAGDDGIGSDDLFTSRVRIHSVPFALRAADSASLGGQPAATYITDVTLTASAWGLDGNAGAGGRFLGTTDNRPVEIRVNNQRVLTLIPNNASPNLIGGHAANTISATAEGGTIGGGGSSGSPHELTGDYTSIGGGEGNHATGFWNTVGGGVSNLANSWRRPGREDFLAGYRRTSGSLRQNNREIIGGGETGQGTRDVPSSRGVWFAEIQGCRFLMDEEMKFFQERVRR